MRRHDLYPSGKYDGWQVIDSTPQEPSDGLFRCGPTSVVAVREGNVSTAFDGPFVYAEVNADEVYWLRRSYPAGSPFKLLDSRTDSIGLNMSTKAVGALNMRRNSITDLYKHPEASRQERETLITALKSVRHQFARLYLNEQVGEGKKVTFELMLLDDVLIGQTFRVTLRMKNVSDQVVWVKSNISVKSAMYTGVMRKTVKKDVNRTRLGPREEEKLIVSVNYEEYENYLEEQAHFMVSCMASVEGTDYEFFEANDFRVRLPDIQIKTHGDLIEGKSFLASFSLQNPLPRTLKRCYFEVEGPSIIKATKLKIPE